ncbi:MAG TPA: rod-binding protein [Pirellulaceae bacterium]|nr:rod-binding protein [Pirellulaceae bacterium]
MNITSALPSTSAASLLNNRRAPEPTLSASDKASPELREAFSSFVGETFYSQMLSSMRSTVQKPAYFHGGRGEEIFQGQLDQIMAEDMTKATSDQFTGPMFDLFMLGRPN